jgi:hypothetical protein
MTTNTSNTATATTEPKTTTFFALVNGTSPDQPLQLEGRDYFWGLEYVYI